MVIADGYVLMTNEDVLLSIDTCADVEHMLMFADFNTPIRVYSFDAAEAAVYEAFYLYQKERKSTDVIEGIKVVPFLDVVDRIEDNLYEVEADWLC